MRLVHLSALCLLLQSPAWCAELAPPPAIDSHIREAMLQSGVQGLAVASIEQGKVEWVGAWGVRNRARQPLMIDTIMYGASLTKTAFAYTVMQLVDEGAVKLDQPIAQMLAKPLPE